MADNVETHNPILKTIWIVEDRLAEILEMGQVKVDSLTHHQLAIYTKLRRDLYKLYNGEI